MLTIFYVCFKSFKRCAQNRVDYSGFDTSSWIPREGALHKRFAIQSLQFKCKEDTLKFEKEHGVCYCELNRLPYFDPVRMCVIDPMHNLLLRTEKHLFHIWVELGILNDTKLQKIDEIQRKIKVPTDIGRIANSISKVYRRMTADEWKHWTLIYSLFCLREVLPPQYYTN